jgi:hypothetical protein
MYSKIEEMWYVNLLERYVIRSSDGSLYHDIITASQFTSNRQPTVIMNWNRLIVSAKTYG